MIQAKVKRILAAAILSAFAFAAYAEDAPVYEVDNYPPPFDGQALDAPVDAPAPPPAAFSGGLTPEVSSTAPSRAAAPREPDAPSAVIPAPPPRPLSMEQRVQRAEQQIKNLHQSGSSAKAEELQKEVQSLRGQLEEMSHQVQQMQSQQKAMYADFDKRLAEAQTVKAPIPTANNDVAPTVNAAMIKPAVKASARRLPIATPAASTKPVAHGQPNAAEEQQIYQTAYDLIKAKKYNDAIVTLQKMLQKYPSGPTAANAHYWLGELYGLLNKNEQSASEFSLVVKKYPGSSKASDAQLKLGLIYVGQFKWNDAKTTLKGVVTRYPGTASARLASEQLKQIKKAGH